MNFTNISVANVDLTGNTIATVDAGGGGQPDYGQWARRPIASRVTVDNGTQVNFIDLTVLNLNGNAGDDVIAVTPNTLAITTINVNGGDPTASDTLIVNGTAARPWRPRATSRPPAPASPVYSGIEALNVYGRARHYAGLWLVGLHRQAGAAEAAQRSRTWCRSFSLGLCGNSQLCRRQGPVRSVKVASDDFTNGPRQAHFTVPGGATVPHLRASARTINALEGDDPFIADRPATGFGPSTSPPATLPPSTRRLSGGDGASAVNLAPRKPSVAAAPRQLGQRRCFGGVITLPGIELSLSMPERSTSTSYNRRPDNLDVTPTGRRPSHVI